MLILIADHAVQVSVYDDMWGVRVAGAFNIGSLAESVIEAVHEKAEEEGMSGVDDYASIGLRLLGSGDMFNVAFELGDDVIVIPEPCLLVRVSTFCDVTAFMYSTHWSCVYIANGRFQANACN